MSTAQRPQSHVTDLGDIEEYVSKASSSWLQCRTKGHNMLDHDVKLNESDDYLVTLRCSRCHTKRHEVVNSDGLILSSFYDSHPEGYLLPKGSGRMDAEGRGIIRAARLQGFVTRKRERYGR